MNADTDTPNTEPAKPLKKILDDMDATLTDEDRAALRQGVEYDEDGLPA